MHKGIQLSNYTGVDINEFSIQDGKQRFRDYNWAHFYCTDFLSYCEQTNDRFDILLVKLTFMFLDQDYLNKLMEIISKKEIVKRIVIMERQLKSHVGCSSIIGSWGNVPVDYSHNYALLFQNAGYMPETINYRHRPSDRPDDIILEGIFIKSA